MNNPVLEETDKEAEVKRVVVSKKATGFRVREAKEDSEIPDNFDSVVLRNMTAEGTSRSEFNYESGFGCSIAAVGELASHVPVEQLFDIQPIMFNGYSGWYLAGTHKSDVIDKFAIFIANKHGTFGVPAA